jgi:BolA family transcriptional regulator, general stress-responsive regulator
LDRFKEQTVMQGPVATAILGKLSAAFAPERLELEDDSHRHAGHHHHGGVDARPGGESHFNLLIVSAAFRGQSRVARQRAVNAALREELAGPVHALSIRALTPEENG